METTHLGLAMPKVLSEIKKILIRRGFVVQTMPTANPIIVAYRNGNWFRKQKKLVLELSSVQQNITRIDVTAILNFEKDIHAEEIIEENIMTTIYNTFKNVIQPHYGT